METKEEMAGKDCGLKRTRTYRVAIHAQSGLRVREVVVKGAVESVPGMVVVEDVETGERFTVHYLKIGRGG